MFHYFLSYSTAVPNRWYSDSNTLNIIVVCIGLFISTCGSYQALVCLVIFCSWSGVLKLAAYKYLGLRSKTTQYTDMNGKPSYHFFKEYVVKEIWCNNKWIALFCPDLLNYCTQSASLWFQDFEHKCWVYWIVYINLWILAGVSFLNTCLLFIWFCLNLLWSIGSTARGELIWGKLWSIGEDTDWNRVIPCKILKITHNYLIVLFYYPFY